MFTIDPNITDVQLKEKDLYKALFSLNNHEVATPDMSLEEARSFVFFFREGKDRFSVFIGLHLLHTDRKLFYTHSANPFLEGVLQDMEDEARNFSEGLGALLDELDFAKMSDSEKSEWIEGQSIFGQKKEPEAAPSAPSVTMEQTQPAPAPVPPPAPVQAAPQSVPAPPAPAVPDTAAPGQQSPAPQIQTDPSPAEAPLAVAAKKRQEIMDKAVKAGIAKPPKQPLARELSTSANVVSRDREVLARLLTSF
jgi:hypothetical protein